MIRRQLPAYSPVVPGRLVRAVRDRLRGRDSSDDLGRLLRERFEADRVLLTGSGTQALRLALEASFHGRGSDDRTVALPGYSCFDLVSAAVGAGARIAFYDLDPGSLAPDFDSLRRIARAGPAAIVLGNLYGFPLDWHALRSELGGTGACLIEDAAQSLGAGADDSLAGSHGDFTILSFGRGKGWSAGAGGALLARGHAGDLLSDAAEPGGLRATTGVKALTTSAALWVLGRPEAYWIPLSVPGLGLGETTYKNPEAVTHMSALVAAVALHHSGASLDAVATRRRWAARWEGLAHEQSWGLRGLAACEPTGDLRCGYLRYPVLTGSPELRRRLLDQAGRFGLARGYPTTLDELPAARDRMVDARTRLPGSEFLASRLVTLPTHPRLTRRDMSDGGDAIDRVLASAGST